MNGLIAAKAADGVGEEQLFSSKNQRSQASNLTPNPINPHLKKRLQ